MVLRKRKLSCRHRNVSKSTMKVKALSRLAGGKPRGCNVGVYDKEEEAVAKAAALFIVAKKCNKLKWLTFI